MLCLVRYLFVFGTSVIDFLGRFVPEMTYWYYVSSGTLNLAQLNSTVLMYRDALLLLLLLLLSFTDYFMIYFRAPISSIVSRV